MEVTGARWLPNKKIKSLHSEKSINCMVLKLTVFIIKCHYLPNFKFWRIFHYKSAILSLAMVMLSLWRHTWNVGTYFGIHVFGKKRSLAFLWYQLHVSKEFHFLSSYGVITTPSQERGVIKKGLIRRGLNWTIFFVFVTSRAPFLVLKVSLCRERLINYFLIPTAKKL